MRFLFFFIISATACFSQEKFPHPQAHAHNDYEHIHPLKDALYNGFTSVEADVHLYQGELLVGHNNVTKLSPRLEQIYLHPLDSILNANHGKIYPGYDGPFYLMIDIKTSAESTYNMIRQQLKKYPDLLCKANACAVKIFLSGNRPVSTLVKEGYTGIALDGRPEDLGKGYSSELMPVISDNYHNWSGWRGKSTPDDKDFLRISDLSKRVHAEGKKLRLWAIPDNTIAWKALMDAGVDLINTDKLEELNTFLKRN